MIAEPEPAGPLQRASASRPPVRGNYRPLFDMTDEPEQPGDDGGVVTYEPETPELFIDAECGWIADAAALCAELNAVAFTMSDGGLLAYVRGRGAVGLGELLKAIKVKKGADVRSIKSEP